MCEKKLWFSRADQLGDEHEGSLPEAMIEERKKRWPDENFQKRLERGSKEGVKDVFVSCWSTQNPESYVMWKIFTQKATGIAIESTVGRLSSCYVKKPYDLFERHNPRIDKIKYINFRKSEEYDDDDFYSRFLHKQKAYKYEGEIRALISDMPTVDTPSVGIGLEVNLDILIDKIFVSNWPICGLDEFVKEILENNRIKKEVIHPLFDRNPSF